MKRLAGVIVDVEIHSPDCKVRRVVDADSGNVPNEDFATPNKMYCVKRGSLLTANGINDIENHVLCRNEVANCGDEESRAYQLSTPILQLLQDWEDAGVRLDRLASCVEDPVSHSRCRLNVE
jgi:hypothetical protein